MKFDEKFKQIISEWDFYGYSYPSRYDRDVDDDYCPYERYDNKNHSSEFEYEWEDLRLIPDQNILVTVTMTAEWKYIPADIGGLEREPIYEEYFEFIRGRDIINVMLYDEDLDKEFELTGEEFKEKYPDQYKVFMEHYFNEPPDTDPDPDEYF